MKNTTQIQKLPDELINKIAAGEVIERPASIVKELLDNSIDAGATKITITLKNGGMTKIEVADNGVGIAEDMLALAFERHATSKISSIEDLNDLLTMGFRGEALSTITSIADVKAISKVANESAKCIEFSNSTEGIIKDAAGNSGTTVTVDNIFQNIPARQKFLKTSQTEYRKVFEILMPYFLLHSNIHFILVKDNKEVLNLPAHQSESTFSDKRAKEALKADFLEDPINLFYDGGGVKIGGLIAHPTFHKKRNADQYIFVNKRPILDKGIYRAVHQGYSRFIPVGDKIPFIINIDINPELVDINVHPRKEEVRFINPYRMYSAVESAVKKALEKETKAGLVEKYSTPMTTGSSREDNAYNRLRDNFSTSRSPSNNKDYKVTADKNQSTQDILGSSLWDATDTNGYASSISIQEELKQRGDNGSIDPENIVKVTQMFKKYIFVELLDEMWVVDQHAAAERITFERLINRSKGKSSDIQELLVPSSINMSSTDLEYLKEHKDFFESLGFAYTVTKEQIDVTAIPSEYIGSDIDATFNSIFEELSSSERDLQGNFDMAKQDILATIACHSSIRSQQYLHEAELKSLVMQLLECDNPYSCPHGRPAVWKMSLSKIDKNFDRTY
jgi:DNA mismatch repair protein MutL